MSSPAGMPQGMGQWPAQQQQGPQMTMEGGGNEDGVSIRPMRLKVLYTFDDQNKTNCLARADNVLQIKTVALDETTSIGILDLKTCIETVVRCSPELLTRVGQDYTVYAYDFSEYDNPLVGQGMLSTVLAVASPSPDVSAQQSQKLITGRVCKNILGIFNNGVKETLEVKLRLVPVPTAVQNDYVTTMEMYNRELNNSLPPNMDFNEWSKFIQSNPNLNQMGNNFGAPPSTTSNHRGSMNMEVVNQLLSPGPLQQQQVPQDSFNQTPNLDSGNEGRSGTSSGKKTKTSRPSSRASVKRPRAKRQPKNAASTGGNTSGYDEGTDGDDGPAPKKRAKITQTDWNSRSSFGTAPDSLRVAASTAGSLRMFRPIAMSPAPNANHLQEIPRVPTPIPNISHPQAARGTEPPQSSLRRNSFGLPSDPPRKHVSPYPPLNPPEGLLRDSIESNNVSPERTFSPAGTPQDIGSSPPVMRTASAMRSSPPCPTSPDLPRMPRTDSGFMSGSLGEGSQGLLGELFGEDLDDDDEAYDDDFDLEPPPYQQRRIQLRESKALGEVHHGFRIEEETPGPMELLPTRMPVVEPPQPRAARKVSRSRGGSIMSDDGQTFPPLKPGSRPDTRRPTPSFSEVGSQMQLSNMFPAPGPDASQTVPVVPQPETQEPTSTKTNDAQTSSAPSQSRRGSKILTRTASMGSLSLPAIPASDPVLPPSTLQRSQTWAEAPHPITDAPVGLQNSGLMHMPEMPQPVVETVKTVPYSRTMTAKKDAIRQKLEAAIANGEMPPFCSNCGAIETPTWRKAWSQEHTGAPGYYEYSDAPGCVTTIVILARDNEGSPTLYQLVKKYLGSGDDKKEWKEFMLCNPCGIWMSKYKSHRPSERWECNKGLPGSKPPASKRPSQRQSRPRKNQSNSNINPTSDFNFPPSDICPPSDAYYPQSEAMRPVEGISPPDTTGTIQQYDLQVQRVELPIDQPRPIRPPKRLNAMTSDAASAALRRAIQSSPARWAGTQNSPIEIDDEMGSTRRLLFPSPRKDGSPKALGEVQTNIVQISLSVRSPKEQTVELPNKENCPPAIDENDADADILALFEEEMARPTTPNQKPPALNLFKTPTRPTPNHRPITRSVSKSIRSAKSPGQLFTFGQQTPSKTPSSLARRRSPRNHHVFESPFTATINQIMSEANNQGSPSQQYNMDMDFSNLPDLPLTDHSMHHGNVDMNFNIDDFFSTDAPMPSSPPKMFQLYEDPAALANVDWSEFNHFDDQPLQPDKNDLNDIVIKDEPREDFNGVQDAPEVTNQQQGNGMAMHDEQTTEQVANISKKSVEDPTEEDEVDMVGVGNT